MSKKTKKNQTRKQKRSKKKKTNRNLNKYVTSIPVNFYSDILSTVIYENVTVQESMEQMYYSKSQYSSIPEDYDYFCISIDKKKTDDNFSDNLPNIKIPSLKNIPFSFNMDIYCVYLNNEFSYVFKLQNTENSIFIYTHIISDRSNKKLLSYLKMFSISIGSLDREEIGSSELFLKDIQMNDNTNIKNIIKSYSRRK